MSAAWPRGLRERWASPTRSGLRRVMAPWEYRHLRAWGWVRMGSVAVLAGLGTVVLVLGSADAKAYGWAAVFLGFATAQLVVAWWELSIARSAGD